MDLLIGAGRYAFASLFADVWLNTLRVDVRAIHVETVEGRPFIGAGRHAFAPDSRPGSTRIFASLSRRGQDHDIIYMYIISRCNIYRIEDYIYIYIYIYIYCIAHFAPYPTACPIPTPHRAPPKKHASHTAPRPARPPPPRRRRRRLRSRAAGASSASSAAAAAPPPPPPPPPRRRGRTRRLRRSGFVGGRRGGWASCGRTCGSRSERTRMFLGGSSWGIAL
jgi:hypothetical protein